MKYDILQSRFTDVDWARMLQDMQHRINHDEFEIRQRRLLLSEIHRLRANNQLLIAAIETINEELTNPKTRQMISHLLVEIANEHEYEPDPYPGDD